MPYNTSIDLPSSVRNHIPEAAQSNRPSAKAEEDKKRPGKGSDRRKGEALKTIKKQTLN